MFHFWNPEKFWKLYDFLKFSGDKNNTGLIWAKKTSAVKPL